MIREGTFKARALSGSFGVDDKSYPTARVEFELVAGPDAGQRITYNGRIDARSAPYVGRDLKAAGWAGKNLDTIGADVERTHVEVDIEIQHKQTKDGARTFPVVRSIGRGAKALAPAPQGELSSANALIAKALGEAPAETEDDNVPF